MTNEENIKKVKEWRVQIHQLFTEIRASQIAMGNTRDKANAITRLQEAKHWLGEELAFLGTATPYPEADNPSNAVVSPTADTGH
jgi:hypothetical protein